MNNFTRNYIEGFMGEVIARNPGENEFHQAVREVVESVAPYVTENPQLMDLKVPSACSATAPSARTRAACASIPA